MIAHEMIKRVEEKTLSFGTVHWNTGTGNAPAQAAAATVGKELNFGTVHWNTGTGNTPAQTAKIVSDSESAELTFDV